MTTPAHKKWLDELSTEMRLNDASGQRIGDAIATVQEYLADSGQSPDEAFGAPRLYAAQLSAASGTSAKAALRPRVISSTASLMVFMALSAALTPWLEGGALLVGGAQLASVAILAALVIALPLYLRFLLRHWWALIAVPIVGGGFGVLSATLRPESATQAFLVLPPLPVVLTSAALLVALSIIGTITALRQQPDPITAPLGDAPANTLKARWFEILTQWLFPILALVMLGLTALVRALS
ncbi:hypothetical protein [Arthrobacter psychrochitiniphilus]|uniref:hypothetical protein n=1 Tax=Arthrobacter psychrochitiniphilus TaxID=291045 RepID=UPI003F7C208B